MNTTYFKVVIEDKIAQVSFNIPDKSNALTMDAWKEMQSIFQALSNDKEVRVVVLSGEGKHFCSGIDLEVLLSMSGYKAITCVAERTEKMKELIVSLQETVLAIENCKKPVLAAVHSGCIGGGLDIVTACDMLYCSEDAFFTVKEIDLAIIADLGTLQRLPRIIGEGIANEMLYTGRKVFGQEAKNIGLVNQCYATKEELIEKVMQLAKTIAAKSPMAIRGTKHILQYSKQHTVSEGLDYIATWNASMLLAEDVTEAFKAMQENRLPMYKD